MANWTRDELLAALNLYHRTPFGRQHQNYSPVIALAERIGRTPSALAMKLNNFTSLDPLEQARGIKGLSGASKADRAIWTEFTNRMSDLADESEAALERFGIVADAPLGTPPSGPSEASAVVRIRRHQRFFRQTVLTSYEQRCCVTGNPIPDLLIASHIVRWADDEEHRVNPRNGLCLAATIDSAFERGLIALDDNYRILTSPRIREFLPNEELERTFVGYEGMEIRLPPKNLPDSKLLAAHRKRHDFA
ncbi:MAG: HNH endonuclease [Verrucomicrobiota bacterium]